MISRELFLAILSMDAYNQGYDRGVEHDKTSVGSATIRTDSEEVLREVDEDPESLTSAAGDGFYALTYTVDGSQIEGWGSQTEVLSFRGTDSPIDYLTGWFIGAGDIFLGA